MGLTTTQYDLLERAIINRSRMAITFHGAQWILVVLRLELHGGRERLHARHPTTGDAMTIQVDQIQQIEMVR